MQLLLFYESNCAGKPTCARDGRKKIFNLALCSKQHSVMAGLSTVFRCKERKSSFFSRT